MIGKVKEEPAFTVRCPGLSMTGGIGATERRNSSVHEPNWFRTPMSKTYLPGFFTVPDTVPFPSPPSAKLTPAGHVRDGDKEGVGVPSTDIAHWNGLVASIISPWAAHVGAAPDGLT